ncbi:MAG TPA: hypothetical protein VMT26_05480 [Candidatus Bathyarchaeia archaeon]|nr:hypothetical protein [Candidatus Bathyarchaeia archaeon]
MAEDSERVKKLIAFKANLEKKIEAVDAELKELKAMLETVDSVLLEKGFRHPEMPKEPAASHANVSPPKIESAVESSVPLPELESVTLLKAAGGEELAIISVEGNLMHVVPAPDKNFDVTVAPFTQFLVERVLTKMQERDNELARTGQLKPDKIFSYNIVREGDVVRELIIHNVDEDRLRELKSSIRWTLEKMYEKMKGQS